MKIGILSDTHDRLSLLDSAVKCLNEQSVDLVLHAGDYISPFVVSHFKPLESKLIGVFGNNDAEIVLLRKKFSEMDAEVNGGFAEILIEGFKIALLHGHENILLKSLISTGFYDFVIHGHTHQDKIYMAGETIVVNPGEVCGYLTGKSTIALLETSTKKTRIVTLRNHDS